MGEKLLLGIDIGSTAVKVVAMTGQGSIRASASAFYMTSSPRPGWMEQDPEDWGRASFQAARKCLEQTGNAEIVALSFSGHMSAPVMLDADGIPLLPGILIADTRSQEQTRFLRESYLERFVELTGNEPVDAFAVSKLLWIKAQHPGVLERTRCILFPKDYVRFLFTGERGTDPTDAGNSLLYNRVSGDWDQELIAELGLDPSVFPVLHASHAQVGRVSEAAERSTGIPAGTPVISGAADMACSQLGTGAVQKGTLAVTLSTSAQVVMSVPGISKAMAGRVTFHPSAMLNSTYAMGSVFTGGLGVDWGYRLLTGKGSMKAADYEELAGWSAQMEQIPPGSNGLLFLPFLLGSGTPYFDPRDRASWLGLSTGQSPALLLHSVMEGVAYNIRENMEQFEQGGYEVRKVNIGGGGSRNPVWCRMIGEVLGKEAAILDNRDAAAAGAAMLAGVGAGMFASAETAALSIVSTSASIPYSQDRHEAYERLYARYLKLYPALNEYYREE
ncbi:xylulokinase [Paenibacillus sp. S150]|uniref:xylulokinase n=1 Tax=Paenibacillus sp. S150 TaxID=2749826 RepID=UPI001C587C30|nr:FGGY family carbohydrate kinase [Paenibacillus sp. S150]MBW4084265.1 Hsp70 family protein [Paenibacillus sp. S150]